jgi:hypothetical protein
VERGGEERRGEEMETEMEMRCRWRARDFWLPREQQML